ncbi:hypothetical protein LEMLEM_LOCUS2558 [Lemmus lemmus]
MSTEKPHLQVKDTLIREQTMTTEKPHLQVGTCSFRVPVELGVTGCWPGLAALSNRATRTMCARSAAWQRTGTRHSAYASTFASHVTSLGLTHSQCMLGKLCQQSILWLHVQ